MHRATESMDDDLELPWGETCWGFCRSSVACCSRTSVNVSPPMPQYASSSPCAPLRRCISYVYEEEDEDDDKQLIKLYFVVFIQSCDCRAFSRTIERRAFTSEAFVYARKEVCERRRSNVAPTIRHSSSATGTPLQGSAYIYPLAYALNSPRVFSYASDTRPSSIRIPIDQPEITSNHWNDVAVRRAFV